MKKLNFFIMIILLSNSIQAQLYINEFMASNDRTIADDAGQYDDWIEIYNAKDVGINLTGHYLTDDLGDPIQWAFPDVIIPAKGYLLIWADNDLGQTGLHANFKLNKDGEQIGLYDGVAFIDSITYGGQWIDVSYGRKEDGAQAWVFFESPYNPPTPKATNIYTYTVTLDPPLFSPGEGFYTGSISVELSTNEPEAIIYYTLDGSMPMIPGMQYTTPISISDPTTIRGIIYKEILSGEKLISDVATKCYLLNIDNAIPLINIACDPGEHNYIYGSAQPGEYHPSIAAHYKYFDEDHILRGDLPIALSMRGAFSLLSPKKSYKITFAGEAFQYDLFDQAYNYPRSSNLPSSFYSLNMIGMNADYSLIRNYLSMQLLRNAGANSPQVSFARLFINGDDRGIYFPMERIDMWFLESRGFDAGDYDIIKTGIEHECSLTWNNQNGDYFELIEGDFAAFNELIIWLNSSSHTFGELSQKLDISAFLYYDLMCRFSNNRDSYDINYYLVKNRDVTDSKWIILIWDTDESFGWDGEITHYWYPYNKAFNQLRQSEEYIHLYQNTLADLLNTRWSQQEVSDLIQMMEQLFETDNPTDEQIWNDIWYDYGAQIIPSFTQNPYYNPLSRYKQFNYIRYWVGERIDYLFDRWTPGTAQLAIQSAAGGNGTIQLNSLYLTSFPWSGTYFKEVPIPLIAIPGPGYRFVGWSDPLVPQTKETQIILHDDYSIHAIFEPDTQFVELIINEINYNSASDFDPEDWIELYNPSDNTIDLSGWHFKDDDEAHDFIFPGGTTINPHGFLVLCRDQSAFHNLFSDVVNYVGDLGFGLSGSGDDVKIFNSSYTLIDSVAYDDQAPWPTEPDGNGPTLELIHPSLDNTLPESWQSSQNHGSPGQPNSNLFSISGNVTYYSSTIPIPQVLVSLTGHAIRNTTTNTNGDFHIDILEGGDYKLKPGKENDVGRAASAFDAAWILQYGVELRTFSPYQMIAGDVSGNGDVSAYDAAFVLQYGVDLINKFPVMGDTTHFWRFMPEDFPISQSNWHIAPDSIIYIPLNSDTTDNLVGICYGDVTGNWQPTVGGFPKADVNIRLKNVYGKSGDRISVPVYIDNGSDIVAMSFTLAYNPRILKAVGAFLTSITHDYIIAYNVKEGRIKVALAGSRPFERSGAIVNLEFEVLDNELPEDHGSLLQITEMVINEGSIAANIQAAEFKIGTPIPEEYALHQNYPNPFNPETMIRYQLPKPGKVTLKIYNALGQEIRTLVNNEMKAGYHEIRWDGRDDNGAMVASGIYIFRLKAGEFVSSKKMLFLR